MLLIIHVTEAFKSTSPGSEECGFTLLHKIRCVTKSKEFKAHFLRFVWQILLHENNQLGKHIFARISIEDMEWTEPDLLDNSA